MAKGRACGPVIGDRGLGAYRPRITRHSQESALGQTLIPWHAWKLGHQGCTDQYTQDQSKQSNPGPMREECDRCPDDAQDQGRNTGHDET